MGSWFSNIHIRTSETATRQAAEDWLRRHLEGQGYLPASEAEADGAVAILGDDEWITVCTDLMDLESPEAVAQIAGPLSADLRTDVLGIACFDSDYLYLNLINTAEKVNAWVGIGSAAGLGIKRRTGLAAWKKKVRDFDAFSACARQKYILAEEFLFEAADHLGLSPERAGASMENLKDLELKAQIFRFKLPEDRKTGELPVLEQLTSSLDPCYLGEVHSVNAVNVGGASRGLSVFFIGPYVEHDELTFMDVWFLDPENESKRYKPLELTKVRLADGQWAYYGHDPNYRIPPKVDERLPEGKRFRMMFDREIAVRFVPRGNSRKVLDITVVIVPDKNPEGQTGWNVWQGFGSKDAYIAWKNKGEMDFYEKYPTRHPKPRLLRREDFD